MQLKIRHVSGISWPRSGHHLLVNILQSYFGSEFRYCEHYMPEIDCCRAYPCQRADRISFSKNHDFAPGVTPAKTPHVIQCRAFPPAVISDFELHVVGGAPDTADEFRNFSVTRVREYIMFVQKWILDQRPPSKKIVILYEDLTARPVLTVSKAIKFFSPGVTIDRIKLEAAIGSVHKEKFNAGHREVIYNFGVRDERRIEEFRHYDLAHFQLLNDLTGPLFAEITPMAVGAKPPTS